MWFSHRSVELFPLSNARTMPRKKKKPRQIVWQYRNARGQSGNFNRIVWKSLLKHTSVSNANEWNHIIKYLFSLMAHLISDLIKNNICLSYLSLSAFIFIVNTWTDLGIFIWFACLLFSCSFWYFFVAVIVIWFLSRTGTCKKYWRFLTMVFILFNVWH